MVADRIRFVRQIDRRQKWQNARRRLKRNKYFLKLCIRGQSTRNANMREFRSQIKFYICIDLGRPPAKHQTTEYENHTKRA